MFYHLKGIITDIEQNMAVIDCNGVGYQLNVSANTLASVKTGDSVKLYVSESIGENNFDLFGFISKGEKRCFEMLTAVSGIGPKAAISILSYNTPESLALAIMNDDVKALTVAPGIGKKIAQRVILELKDKIGKESGGTDIQLPVMPQSRDNSTLNDAVAALAFLGYSSAEINPAIAKLDVSGMSAEQIIKAVLKMMLK